MTHNKYITIIGAAGVLSWIAWWVVINKLNPLESTGLALAFFFITLFIAMACTFTVIGFYFRVWLNKNEIYYFNMYNSSIRKILDNASLKKLSF